MTTKQRAAAAVSGFIGKLSPAEVRGLLESVATQMDELERLSFDAGRYEVATDNANTGWRRPL
jgi:hypothetical protein